MHGRPEFSRSRQSWVCAPRRCSNSASVARNRSSELSDVTTHREPFPPGIRSRRRRGIQARVAIQSRRRNNHDPDRPNDPWERASAEPAERGTEMPVSGGTIVRYLRLASKPAELCGIDKNVRGVHNVLRAPTTGAMAIHHAARGADQLESHFTTQTAPAGRLFGGTPGGPFSRRDPASCHFKLPRVGGACLRSFAARSSSRRNGGPAVGGRARRPGSPPGKRRRQYPARPLA